MIKYLRINKDTLLIILSIITCLTSAPYITHYLFGSLYVVFSAALSFLVFVCTLKYYQRDNWINLLWVFAFAFIAYGIIMLFFMKNPADLRKAIGMLIKITFVIGSASLIRKHYKKYLSVFFTINNLIIFFSIILFFILLVFPYDAITFIKQDGRPHYLYLPLGATNVRFLFGGFTFIRIAGFADEPGALALIISYLLVLNEITLKSSRNRLLYIIGGILTFSMAFFITIIPLIVYWVKSRVINLKYIIIIIVIMSSSAFVFLDKETAAYQAFDKLVFSRFTQSDDGTLSGDNRSAHVPKQLEAFYASPILGVGCSEDQIIKYDLGVPSFFSYLGTHGVIGYMLFYIPFIFLFIYKKKFRLILMVIALNFLQRPSVEEMFALISLSLIYYSKFYDSNPSNIDNNSIL